ncbi:MAG: hypothetical protein M1813_009064 [Trichoglossum hirsutum]|nr:MAG: hypothetical protein M1813_009064 [Trichoglossum hirsutum]
MPPDLIGPGNLNALSSCLGLRAFEELLSTNSLFCALATGIETPLGLWALNRHRFTNSEDLAGNCDQHTATGMLQLATFNGTFHNSRSGTPLHSWLSLILLEACCMPRTPAASRGVLRRVFSANAVSSDTGKTKSTVTTSATSQRKHPTRDT